MVYYYVLWVNLNFVSDITAFLLIQCTILQKSLVICGPTNRSKLKPQQRLTRWLAVNMRPKTRLFTSKRCPQSATMGSKCGFCVLCLTGSEGHDRNVSHDMQSVRPSVSV